MKKITISFVIFCASFVFLENLSIAQWEANVRITNNDHASETSFNNAWCIAAAGQSVHIVWFDSRDNGNYEIYYRRSSNEGVSWGSDMRLTNSTGESRYPSIAINGQILHLVWRDARSANPEIYYRRSTDLGITWQAEMRLTNDSDNSLPPSMAVSGNFVHVIWSDDRDGNAEIYYKRSTDNGLTWEPDLRLTDDPMYSMLPSIAANGLVVHAVWHDSKIGLSEIYYKRSTNGGSTWEADMRLTNTPAESRYPCISVSGPFVHLVWSDELPGIWKVYYKRSTDQGISWSQDTMISPHIAGFSEFSSIASSGEIVHVAWADLRNGNWEIYYKNSFDQGVNWQTDERLTNASDDSWFPTIAASGNMIHAVWSDFRDDNYEIYYSRDTTGNLVGINPHALSELPAEFSLYQNYPNPFNPVTRINFDLPKSGNVVVKIYDALGREVTTLVNEKLNAGIYAVDWNAANYPSGVYFYQLISGSYTETKKMVLTK